MTMTKDSSPFSKTQFHPIGDIYTKEGKLFGLKKPNGEIVVNFDHNTTYSMLLKIARITGCELVVVSGQWTFIPHRTRLVTDEESEWVEHNGNHE